MSTVLRSATLFFIGSVRVWFSPNGRRLSMLVFAAELVIATVICGWVHFIPILLLIAWQPTTRYIASLWTASAAEYVTLPRWVLAGPLGKGCSKVIEVLIAALAWKFGRGKMPLSLLPRTTSNLTFETTLMYALALICCSVAVNFVLGAWSMASKSRGAHDGLEKYAKQLSSKPRLQEEVELLSLAAANAFCEECTSRGFWRQEFVQTSGLSWVHANVPSGWSGVGLTFLYGLLMGWLADWSGGALLLPILTHTMADYYIFSVIMRRKTFAQ